VLDNLRRDARLTQTARTDETAEHVQMAVQGK
jgi:hypothetical protein